jgi:small conductance mechanosensitive channel
MEKTVEFYNDVIQYFKLNYINLGFVLLFVVAGFLTANFIKRRIKGRISKRSPNPITATFISQIISFALKTIVY